MSKEPRRILELEGVTVPARPLVTPPEVGGVERLMQKVGGIKTRGNFARDLFPQIGVRGPNRHTLVAMMAWMQAEGDAGRFNPLNTTHAMPGSSDFNWVHVQNYDTYADGVRATSLTMNYGASNDLYGYKPIRDALRKGLRAEVVLAAVEESAWGTGGLALKVLEETGWEALLSNRYLHHRLAQS